MLIAPKDHVLVHWDFSQIESWIVAFLANEPNMKHSLLHGDIHTDTASIIFEADKSKVTAIMRYLGKQTNHACDYMIGYLMLARLINRRSDQPPHVTVTTTQTKKFHTAWNDYYNLKDWWQDLQDQLGENRTLVTPYGRVRVFFEAWGQDLFKEAAAHMGQSTAADHTNGKIHPELGIKGGISEVYNQFVEPGIFKMIHQGHDSMTNEVHKDKVDDIIEPVTKLFRRPIVINDEQFTIPVECKLGERWGELTPIDV